MWAQSTAALWMYSTSVSLSLFSFLGGKTLLVHSFHLKICATAPTLCYLQSQCLLLFSVPLSQSWCEVIYSVFSSNKQALHEELYREQRTETQIEYRSSLCLHWSVCQLLSASFYTFYSDMEYVALLVHLSAKVKAFVRVSVNCSVMALFKHDMTESGAAGDNRGELGKNIKEETLFSSLSNSINDGL